MSGTRRSPATPWRSRIVGHADVPPGDIVANPLNWRRHPDSQRRPLRGILADVGWVTRVIVNRTSGYLVDGHVRVEEALARDEPTVPVTYIEVTPDEERLLLAAFDPLAALAEADGTALAELLASISAGDPDLAAMLDALAAASAAVRPAIVDPDDVPDLPAESADLCPPRAALEGGSSQDPVRRRDRPGRGRPAARRRPPDAPR